MQKEKIQYYNYIYLDPRKPGKYEYQGLDFCLLYEPFYVGKGKDNRYLDHIKEAKRKGMVTGNLKNNKIVKILELNYNIKDYILRLNFTTNEKEALDYEIKLIKEIGRLDLKEGTLTNLTPGGDGVSGMITCIDNDGNKLYITTEEYHNRNDVKHHSKGKVYCKDLNGNKIITTVEEYKIRNDLTHCSTNKVNVIKNGIVEAVSVEEYYNNPNLISLSKGRVNCKDNDGNTFSVTKEEFDNRDDLVGCVKGIKTHTNESKKKISDKNKNTIGCKDITTNKTMRVSLEEYYNNENLIFINQGRKHTEEAKNKFRLNNIGSKSNTAKRINIYNERNELMFECHGNFEKVCKENNLPQSVLVISYRNNGTKIYQDTKNNKIRLIKNGLIKYKGWYAKEDK
jgi:hypothetical protein